MVGLGLGWDCWWWVGDGAFVLGYEWGAFVCFFVLRSGVVLEG